ncbi:hypothetical protein [Haliangium ochraceum]|uniref:Uncharacterized protein n=1 Tax=Haliangium ochraceum (strain DSM 14365 / JCM 11303 / SMP-2) TaxID=502025 RepID=D0LWH6_HALO1|nr:hypothetical protein [Haliangium ochraceum]ACY17626.1 hypothetical protein Hoch_5138 [Haliangium ochraceum DSM 14365]
MSAAAPCPHSERQDGVCTACGDCAHEVILNGACYQCGTSDLDGLAMSPKPSEQIVPAARLVRGRDNT